MYKALHILMPSIFAAFDGNIACVVFSENPRERCIGGNKGGKANKRLVNVENYVRYSICLGRLARYLVDRCDFGFEPTPGFGYARRLSIGGLQLYFPLTRLLDYVVWSMSTVPRNKDKDVTVYDQVVKNCV
ncbi:hypothetical protein [Pyrodictium abyssi]|uniref:Uncharacterized protein n=1 Tax=Pyrodictium abyssi TaxID=54256 RepID=A0ABN6ZTX2_9CREN|nr:hypothetical protein PABY_17720 [Pyrodictium abyssi]